MDRRNGDIGILLPTLWEHDSTNEENSIKRFPNWKMFFQYPDEQSVILKSYSMTWHVNEYFFLNVTIFW